MASPQLSPTAQPHASVHCPQSQTGPSDIVFLPQEPPRGRPETEDTKSFQKDPHLLGSVTVPVTRGR